MEGKGERKDGWELRVRGLRDEAVESVI